MVGPSSLTNWRPSRSPTAPVEAKVVLGHTGVKLIEVAEDGEDGPAELVVLGSRGLGGFKGLLLGSVTTYAVHHLTCRLLVVPTTVRE